MGFSSLAKTAGAVAPHAGMILMQMSGGCYSVLSKAMLVPGLSTPIFLVYQHLVASIFVAAMAFIFERGSRPGLSGSILLRIFLLALLGTTISSNLLAASLFFISSTVQSAVFNMVPVFIFIVAVLSRQEKLGIDTTWGRGKLFGTFLSVSGALCLVLWHGSSSASLLTGGLRESMLGCIMAVLGVLGISTWLTFLGPMSRLYPAKMSLNALLFFFGAAQTSVLAAIVSPQASKWRLNWDLELFNIFYGGLFQNGMSGLLLTWCTSVKGPIFVASFSPLGLLFATILETIFMGQTLYWESAIGGAVIAGGLYVYLFFKTREELALHCSVDDDDDDYFASP